MISPNNNQREWRNCPFCQEPRFVTQRWSGCGECLSKHKKQKQEEKEERVPGKGTMFRIIR
jgi:hypothetical protein